MFAIAGSFIQAIGLSHAERHRIRIVIGAFVYRHPAILLQGGFLQSDGERKQRLIAFYGQPIGLCMKERSLFFGGGERTVGQGKTYPNLNALSACTSESGHGLRKQGCLRLDILHFRPTRKAVHFDLYQSVVLLELSSVSFRTSVSDGRIHTRNLVDMNEMCSRTFQTGKGYSQLRDVTFLVLVPYLFNECLHRAKAPLDC